MTSDYKDKEEKWKNTELLTEWWTKLHMRKWGSEVLNLDKYKGMIAERINSISDSNYDDIEDLEINARVSLSGANLLRRYYSIKIESIVKKAFLITALDGRVTVMERDILKAIFSVDTELEGFIETNYGTDQLLSDVYKNVVENNEDD